MQPNLEPEVRYPEAPVQADVAKRNTVWFLVGQTAPGEPVRPIPVASFPFTIGRHPDRSLCLPYRTISGTHAELVESGDDLIVRDLNSTNGTFVDGARVKDQAVLVPGGLVQFSEVAFRIQRQVNQSVSNTLHEDVCSQALTLVQFDKLMSERSVVPYFQPIVEMSFGRVVGHEILGRSEVVGLESIQQMFAAASQLSLEVELSRMLRWEGVGQAQEIPVRPDLYVNTHPEELRQEGLIQSMASLREAYPNQALTLEIHEAAVSDPAKMLQLRAALRELGIRLAFDDFGAGQARMVELAEVCPDVLKFDMSLIRDIDSASTERKQMVEMLVRMANEVGTTTLAEGIETEGERQFCQDVGFSLAQGFLFGRPAPAKFYQQQGQGRSESSGRL